MVVNAPLKTHWMYSHSDRKQESATQRTNLTTRLSQTPYRRLT